MRGLSTGFLIVHRAGQGGSRATKAWTSDGGQALIEALIGTTAAR